MGFHKSQTVKAVTNLSEGLLSKAMDLALVALFLNLEFATTKKSNWSQVGGKVVDDLAVINYQTLKRAFTHLKNKGLIQTLKEKSALPKITAAGKRKIDELLPKYDERRIWDKRVYLITYDFPVAQNFERNRLREFLRKIGCGMLQQSLWLTPYNPTELVKEFVEENNLDENLILVSSLGKDGTIGSWELPELMEKVYPLSKINEEYRQFILEAKNRSSTKAQIIFRFLSILATDPQLPFQLLPSYWLGNQAYKIYTQVSRITNFTNTC